MIDMPDDVADAVDSEEDAFLVRWERERHCDRCGRSWRAMLALVNASSGREQLYCDWDCMVPPEWDEEDTQEDAVDDAV
jgi:hypothetical protein